MPVLALVEDLLFQQKIQSAADAAGVAVKFGADVTAAGSPCLPAAAQASAGQPWALVLVDVGLTRRDPLALIAALRRQLPQTPIIGYGAHVDAAQLVRARQAGCTEVLARSAFVQRLPELLAPAVP